LSPLKSHLVTRSSNMDCTHHYNQNILLFPWLVISLTSSKSLWHSSFSPSVVSSGHQCGGFSHGPIHK
jgi:hypothetical protein